MPPLARSHARGRPRRNVAWDRIGRVVMLAVLVVLAYLYVSAGRSLLSTWHAKSAADAQEATLAAQNRALRRQTVGLSSTSSVIAQARRLGMAMPGEQPYVVLGLPSN